MEDTRNSTQKQQLRPTRTEYDAEQFDVPLPPVWASSCKKTNAFMTRYLFSFKIYINAVLRRGRGSVVGVPNTLQNTAVRIPVGTGDLISFKTSRSALGSSQPSIYWELLARGGGVSRNKMAGVWRPLTPILNCDWHSASYNSTHHRPSDEGRETTGRRKRLSYLYMPTENINHSN